ISLVVDIREDDLMSLLQVPQARGLGDVQEAFAVIVAQGNVRPQCFVQRFARSQIDVEPSIVVEISEAAAHWAPSLADTRLDRDILERAVAVVLIKTWQRGMVRLAHQTPSYVGNARIV